MDDFEIDIPAEIARKPLSTGDFLQVVALLQNRMNSQALAAVDILKDDMAGFQIHMSDALKYADEANKVLLAMVGQEQKGVSGNDAV